MTGKDNQVISGRHDLIVHSGQLYIGLAPRAMSGRPASRSRSIW